MSPDEDPMELFREWYREAERSESIDFNAVALASADAEGVPSVRMVLLKGVDDKGFVFYTNLESRKGQELAANPHAAMCFHWKSMSRQVRVEGPVERVSESEADSYFASRDRTSQIGAWASKQSRPLAGRFELESAVAKSTARFHVGKVPRPPFWSGFRLRAVCIEFWTQGRFRLHDRAQYRLANGQWSVRHLYP